MKRVFFALAVATTLINFGVTNSVSAQDAKWGHLTGRIVVEGTAPENPIENAKGSADEAACLVDGKIPKDDGILVSEKNELKNVFLYMYLGRGSEDAPEAFHPQYDELKKVKLALDNVKCRFEPKALFARTGQTVELKNSDAVGHNCHITLTSGEEHNISIPPNKSVDLKLAEEDDRFPGKVVCDIHSWMDSVMFVRDNPYVSISGADGKFTMENIPVGTFSFQLWHKEAGFLKTAKINGYEVNAKRGYFNVEVKAGETVDLGTITISADAFDD
ncbi:MAG: hypothetical protein AB8B55_16840 [Mariniblastus sp.]